MLFLTASTGWEVPRPAWVHGVLALGILPLILAAMIYFTPVLTRGVAPPGEVLTWPVLGMAGGLIATSSFLEGRGWLPLAGAVAGLAAAGLLWWTLLRARRTLGTPHPCLPWYQWALVCLLAGLVSIMIGLQWPVVWTAARRLHLHLNVLGFVGLTALGTLQVLVPTTAKYQDPATRTRLRRDLPWAVAGTVLVAIGAVGSASLSVLGALLWGYPLVRFLISLFAEHRRRVWGWSQASTALAGATVGLLLVLAAGLAHALGAAPEPTVELFFFAFLFPLVTGAVTYLFPVWVWPGPAGGSHAALQRRLALGSAWRTLAFIGAGLLAWLGLPGGYLALVALGAFFVQGIWAFSKASPRV
jgi:hypothetical protein